MPEFHCQKRSYHTKDFDAKSIHDLLADLTKAGDVGGILSMQEALEAKQEKRRRGADSEGMESGVKTHKIPDPDLGLMLKQIQSCLIALVEVNPELYGERSVQSGVAQPADVNKEKGAELISRLLDRLDQSKGKEEVKASSGAVPVVRMGRSGRERVPGVVLFRKQSKVEANKVVETGELSRKAFTERCKWFSESPEKVKAFSNKSVSKGGGEAIVELLVDGDLYLKIRERAIPQENSSGKGEYIYHREGLSPNSPLINIGVPEEKDKEFNAMILDAEKS